MWVLKSGQAGFESLGCHFLFHFFKDLFIYLKVRVTQREREVFHLLVHSPDGRNGRSCANPKPGARTEVSPTVAENLHPR